MLHAGGSRRIWRSRFSRCRRYGVERRRFCGNGRSRRARSGSMVACARLCRDEKGRPVNVAVKRPFKLYCELEASSTKNWLVKNLLGVGEASACYGVPGCGKSALVEDMGLHIAAGLPWHGRDVSQGAVCYVALERKV